MTETPEEPTQKYHGISYESRDRDHRAPYVIIQKQTGRRWVLMKRDAPEPETFDSVTDAEERIAFIASGEEDPEPASDGCFLTTACEVVMGQAFRDDALELETLRRHRDRLAAERSALRPLVTEYYDRAPRIVDAIAAEGNGEEVYRGIYDRMVLPTGRLLDAGRDDEAIDLYYREFIGLRDRYGV